MRTGKYLCKHHEEEKGNLAVTRARKRMNLGKRKFSSRTL